MSQEISYIDYFPRHSFGEIPLLVYDDLPSNTDNVFRFGPCKHISTDENDDLVVFLLRSSAWEGELGKPFWLDQNFAQTMLREGQLCRGKVSRQRKSHFKSSSVLPGEYLLSPMWTAEGMRHLDFVERNVPIPDDDSCFHDYISRWRHREIIEQGFDRKNLSSEEYNDKFNNVNPPYRYNFYLPEEAEGEPECYYVDGKMKIPCGFPLIDDLYAPEIDECDEGFYGLTWRDPQYPDHNAIVMWVERKDTRLKCKLAMAYRSGDISLFVVPFYFTLR